MRSRHCRVCGDWHDLNGVWPTACLGHFAARGPRSALSAPMIIRDSMDPVQSMVDGKLFDSKRAYERSVREAGCEIVGNDFAPFEQGPREYEPVGIEQDIKRAIEELNSGTVNHAAA